MSTFCNRVMSSTPILPSLTMKVCNLHRLIMTRPSKRKKFLPSTLSQCNRISVLSQRSLRLAKLRGASCAAATKHSIALRMQTSSDAILCALTQSLGYLLSWRPLWNLFCAGYTWMRFLRQQSWYSLSWTYLRHLLLSILYTARFFCIPASPRDLSLSTSLLRNSHSLPSWHWSQCRRISSSSVFWVP